MICEFKSNTEIDLHVLEKMVAFIENTCKYGKIFQNTAFICVQHSLSSNARLFQALGRLGAKLAVQGKNSHVFSLGKIYSESPHGREEIGALLGDHYFEHDRDEKDLAYKRFSEPFHKKVQEMFACFIAHLKSEAAKEIDSVVVIDDGGALINVMMEAKDEEGKNHLLDANGTLLGKFKVSFVEQTTAGLRDVITYFVDNEEKSFQFKRALSSPLVGISTCLLKKIEPDFIAEAVGKSIALRFPDMLNTDENLIIGIIGYGFIGKSIEKYIQWLNKTRGKAGRKNHTIKIYDNSAVVADEIMGKEGEKFCQSPEDIFLCANIIFGASGNDVTAKKGKAIFEQLKRSERKGILCLVSCSSENKEFFDFVNTSFQDGFAELDKDFFKVASDKDDKSELADNIKDIVVKINPDFTVKVVRSGYPINFMPPHYSVPRHKIQVIVGCIIGAALQAKILSQEAHNDKDPKKNLHRVWPILQNVSMKFWLEDEKYQALLAKEKIPLEIFPLEMLAAFNSEAKIQSKSAYTYRRNEITDILYCSKKPDPDKEDHDEKKLVLELAQKPLLKIPVWLYAKERQLVKKYLFNFINGELKSSDGMSLQDPFSLSVRNGEATTVANILASDAGAFIYGTSPVENERLCIVMASSFMQKDSFLSKRFDFVFHVQSSSCQDLYHDPSQEGSEKMEGRHKEYSKLHEFIYAYYKLFLGNKKYKIKEFLEALFANGDKSRILFIVAQNDIKEKTPPIFDAFMRDIAQQGYALIYVFYVQPGAIIEVHTALQAKKAPLIENKNAGFRCNLLLGEICDSSTRINIEKGNVNIHLSMKSANAAQIRSVQFGASPLCYRSNIETPDEDYIATQNDAALSEKMPFVLSKTKKVALTGLPGIGKTELAEYYAYEYMKKWESHAKRHDFPIIYIFHDLPNDPPLKQWQRLALLLGVSFDANAEEKLIFDVVNNLLLQHKNSLLVFDNAENLRAIEKFLPNGAHENLHLLVTTQRQDFFEEKSDQTNLPLLPFTEEDALKLFFRALGKDTDEKAKELVAELEHLPLAIKVAGSFMKQEEIRCCEYLKLLHSKEESSFVRSQEEKLAKNRKYKQSQWQALLLVIDKLIAINHIYGNELLFLFSFLPPDDITLHLILNYLQNKYPAEKESIFKLKIKSTLRDLFFNYSLLKLNKNSDAKDACYKIHRLVQEVIRTRHQKICSETASFRVEFLFKINFLLQTLIALSPKDEESLSAKHLWLRQAEQVFWHLENMELIKDSDQTKISSFIISIGDLEESLGALNIALKYFEKALKIRTKSLAPPLEIAECHQKMGCVYNILGKHRLALWHHEKEIAIRKEILGPNHRDVAESHNDLGEAYRSLAEYDAALKNFSEALRIYRLFPNEHLDLLSEVLNNMGITYAALKDYEKEFALLEEAFKIGVAFYGTADHPKLAITLLNLGCAYQNRNDYVKALALKSRAEKNIRLFYGENCFFIAICLHNIASIYETEGKYDEALHNYIQAIAILKKIDLKHPEIAKMLNNLGRLYSDLEQYENALRHAEEALSIAKETYESNHPLLANIKTFIFSCLNNIAIAHKKRGDMEKSLHFYNLAYDACKELDPNHKEMAICLSNMGVLYAEHDNFIKAIEHHKKALKIWYANLSPDHPNITMSLNNIGMVYNTMGEHKKALFYFMKALALAMPNEKKPNTFCVESLKQMGTAHKAMKNFADALGCYEKALDMAKSLFADNPLEAAKILNIIGALYHAASPIQNLRLAILYQIQALEIIQKNASAENKSMGASIANESSRGLKACLNNITTMYKELGEYDIKSLSYFEQLLEIEKKESGEDSFVVADLFNSIGAISNKLRKYKDAVTPLEKALRILRSKPNANPHNLVICLESLRIAHHTLGDNEKELWCLSQMHKVRKKDPYDKPRDLLYNLIDICQAKERIASDAREILSHYEEAIAIAKSFSTDPFLLILALNNAAVINARLRKKDISFAYMTQALEISNRAFGPYSQISNMITRNMEVLRANQNNYGTLYLGDEREEKNTSPKKSPPTVEDFIDFMFFAEKELEAILKNDRQDKGPSQQNLPHL